MRREWGLFVRDEDRPGDGLPAMGFRRFDEGRRGHPGAGRLEPIRRCVAAQTAADRA
jgi:hypothetical protein